MGVNSLLKTVTRQRRDCNLNLGPSVPESSMLTTWLSNHPAVLPSCNWWRIPIWSITSGIVRHMMFNSDDVVCSLVCLRDELLVSTGRGLLQRLRWSDGVLNTEMTIEVASIPFSTDLQHSRCVFIFCGNLTLEFVYVMTYLRSLITVNMNSLSSYYCFTHLTAFFPVQPG